MNMDRFKPPTAAEEKPRFVRVTCPRCDGDGETCKKCNGKGYIEEEIEEPEPWDEFPE